MSVQFGRWGYGATSTAAPYIEKVSTALTPRGPDGSYSFSGSGVTILYYAFHTAKESRREKQPHISESGAVITWDGRLDNRADFIGHMNSELSADSSDVSIVSAAYERWGTNCFAKLIGDWALSIWNPYERSVILAKDPIGTRHLYYSADEKQITWSSMIEPLILFAGKTFALDEEYIAGWLSFFPATRLTPYVGIESVSPSSFVRFENGKRYINVYWQLDRSKKIRYKTDCEYEEHFRMVLRQSVRRRLRSDAPVLAELSGGMDSSSIVCMADAIIAEGGAQTPGVETVSYYDDSEPNWNEWPYFAKVEERRGRTGFHIDVGIQGGLKFGLESDGFAATPGSGLWSSEATKQFIDCMTATRSRVLLSGIGGDEFTGGVPTPIPELSDLLATGQFKTLARQLKVWALNKRRPWMYLLLETFRSFLPTAFIGIEKYRRPASWLRPEFVTRNFATLVGYQSRLKLFGSLPSFQENVRSLAELRRQLGCSYLSASPPHEKSYPFLDRDLLEFTCAIPRQQLVRPGQRRSLMRRALVGIVPDEILNRKRKAFVDRTPIAAISANQEVLADIGKHIASGLLRIVDPDAISDTLQMAFRGHDIPAVSLLRTLALESWLRGLVERNILADLSSTHLGPSPADSRRRPPDSPTLTEFS
jgi:asparagine synthase (glutamine-hydrolysing)